MKKRSLYDAFHADLVTIDCDECGISSGETTLYEIKGVEGYKYCVDCLNKIEFEEEETYETKARERNE